MFDNLAGKKSIEASREGEGDEPRMRHACDG
jgi:hypothetical protein